MAELLFGTSRRNERNHLEIGGCDTVELAEEYGTPLFVYDVELIRQKMREFKQTFEELNVKHKVAYASKAFSCIAIYQIVKEEGLACDVVSGGELFTALKAGISGSSIAFHGNNKSKSELEMAVDNSVGTIIVDNFYEIQLLQSILEEKNKVQDILLRVAPGVDAHTHEFILTGQEDSKFGFDVKSGQAEQALEMVLNQSCFNMRGFHCHIGSQIFSMEGFNAAADKMLNLLVTCRDKYDFVSEVLNLGGGFGVKYNETDEPLEAPDYVRQIVDIVKSVAKENDFSLPEIWIEPGRSLVAEAGTTLYEVGSRKEVAGVRTYVSVDGGMGDNIRTSLYNANYEAILANRVGESEEESIRLVGKYCESGDIVIKEIELPKLQPGDILAVTTTGAYGYSMASNYNRNPRPAVVFCENGNSQLVIKRETFEDLVQNDMYLNK